MLSPRRLSAEKSLLIVFRLPFYRQKPQDIFYNLIAVDGKKQPFSIIICCGLVVCLAENNQQGKAILFGNQRAE